MAVCVGPHSCGVAWLRLCARARSYTHTACVCTLDEMPLNDRLLGACGFALSLALYAYYTAWVIVAPFIDPQSKRSAARLSPSFLC